MSKAEGYAAQAVATQPSIVLGDEITGNLDTKTTGNFSLVRNLNKNLGTTFTIATHNMEVANKTDLIIQLRRRLGGKDIRIQNGVVPADMSN